MSFNEWKETELGEVIEIDPIESLKKGAIAKKVGMDKLNSFNREIQGFEITEFNGGTKFKNGDTLLARITPCLENGKTAQVRILDKNEIAFGSTEFIVMREKANKTINDFIYYLSISNDFRNIAIKSMTGTSGRQRAQKDVLKKTIIKLPPIKVQKNIAHILSTIDDKIELNDKINENIQSISQLLFKHWFVDFEFPNEEGLPYKSSGGEMIESELGMIPTGWEIKTIDDITYNFDSKRKPLSSRQRDERKGIYPYYGATSIIDFIDNYIFDGIYVLLGEDGTVINNDGTPVLQYIWKKAWVNNHAHILQGKSISTELLFLYLKQLNVSNIVTGAVQLKINQANLNSVKIILANKKVINQFEELIQGLFAKIRNLVAENESLVNLRDTLLPKLMNGEIDVSDIEINPLEINQ